MDIIVLAGGTSPERDVSLASGANIVSALKEAGHRAKLLDLFFGESRAFADFNEYYNSEQTAPKAEILDAAPDINALFALRGGRSGIGPNVIKLLGLCDIVFIALHGSEGEDGRIQAALDLHRIPYTGSPYLPCAIAMDKELSKRIMVGEGVNMPGGLCLSAGNSVDVGALPYPCAVKPCNSGSSIGVSIVRRREDMYGALRLAFKYCDRALIEEYIPGRELAVGILDGRALSPIEIIPKEGFFDYRNKYASGATDEICPANISADTAARMKGMAELANRSLGLKIYSRADFILRDDGEIYCLEINALPGMTQNSLLPKEALAEGISYVDLCDTIVRLSMKKYE